jgi:hypothetical protein
MKRSWPARRGRYGGAQIQARISAERPYDTVTVLEASIEDFLAGEESAGGQ